MSGINVLFDATKLEAVKKAIGGGDLEMRKVFAKPVTDSEGKPTGEATPDLESAVKAFEAATAAAPEVSAYFPTRIVVDKKGKPVLDADGNEQQELDLSLFETANPVVAVVGARVKNATTGKMDSGIRAILLFPLPTVQQFLDSENGASFVAKVIEKEAAHVSFRELRNAETQAELDAAFAGMPRDVDSFVASHTRGGGVNLDTFNTAWPDVKAELKQKATALYDHLPQKADLIRAIRSKKAAEQIDNDLESRGIFVWLANAVIKFAENWKDKDGNADPLDTTPIQEWLENREVEDLSKAEKAKDLDALDKFAAGLNF